MTTPKLFEPLTMGDFELKNRIVLAPMTRGRAGVERIAAADLDKVIACANPDTQDYL